LVEADTQDEDTAEDIHRIIRQTEQCRGIIKGLLNFARPSGSGRGRINLAEVLRETAYLMEKNRHGYVMVNSRKHLADMKDFMRGNVKPWLCRAGQSTLIIRTDGSLAPCFAMDSATHDWGTAENPKFDVAQLDEMKASCNTHCLSTCNYITGHYYNGWRWFWWALKQLVHGYQGIRAGVEAES
jgi:MoaA/NifB/PqqE/SkfB family radical SAM enzyme